MRLNPYETRRYLDEYLLLGAGRPLDALREVADKAHVNWDLVLKTDAAPQTGDWDKLMILVGRAMPGATERRTSR